MDCSPPDSCVHGILQARILEWIPILFSRESSPPRDQTWVSALQTDSLPSELLIPIFTVILKEHEMNMFMFLNLPLLFNSISCCSCLVSCLHIAISFLNGFSFPFLLIHTIKLIYLAIFPQAHTLDPWLFSYIEPPLGDIVWMFSGEFSYTQTQT